MSVCLSSLIELSTFSGSGGGVCVLRTPFGCGLSQILMHLTAFPSDVQNAAKCGTRTAHWDAMPWRIGTVSSVEELPPHVLRQVLGSTPRLSV